LKDVFLKQTTSFYYWGCSSYLFTVSYLVLSYAATSWSWLWGF